jgi:hypothetical protein
LKRRHGQARLIEAVLTLALLLPASMYLLYYYTPPTYSDASLYDAAAAAVVALDEKGVLLSLLTSNDTVGLQQAFRASLPGDVDFILIYSQNELLATRLGPSQAGASSIQVAYVILSPSGTAFHVTLIIWRK